MVAVCGSPLLWGSELSTDPVNKSRQHKQGKPGASPVCGTGDQSPPVPEEKKSRENPGPEVTGHYPVKAMFSASICIRLRVGLSMLVAWVWARGSKRS